MTELEAVNLVLPALGEDLITSVADPSSSSALILQHLKFYTSQVLQRAWWFNVTRISLQTSVATGRGEILTTGWGLQDFIPDDQRYMLQGDRLINRQTAEPWFNAGEKITGWGIRVLDFEALPEIVQQFVVAQTTLHVVTDRFAGGSNVSLYAQQVHTLQDAMTQTHTRHMRNVILPPALGGHRSTPRHSYGYSGRRYAVRTGRVDGSHHRLGG